MTESKTTGYKKLGIFIHKRFENYDEKTRRKNELLKKLINSKKSASSLEILAGIMISKNKSRISLTHFDENEFTVNPYSPKNDILEGNC